MRINLAKFPLLVWIVIVGSWLIHLQSAEDTSPSSYADGEGPAPTGIGTPQVDRYLDRVAKELARPGLYVDPAVDRGSLTETEIDDLDAEFAKAGGPVRVAVLPADRLDVEPEYSYTVDLAYEPDELVGQLYDRVGADGTYAILVDADSADAGRSFTAYQYAEERPFYDVEGALNQAVDCCAPDYGGMLESFAGSVGDEQTDWGRVLGFGAAGLALLGAAWWGGRRLLAVRRTKAASQSVADDLRAPLNEEVIELSTSVSALPADGGSADVDQRTRRVLDLVEQARHRLDAMQSAEVAEEITARLADARYELGAIAALRAGRPVPEKTEPCFFDPRHGPSVDEHPFAPEDGAERPVPVCVTCRALLEADRRPEIRMVEHAGKLRFYWDLGESSRPYVNGYYRRSFPVARVESVRRTPVGHREPKRDPAFTFVWETSGSRGGSSSGGGSSRRSSRSFGGGRSSRSSTRSGGSRRF